MGRRVIGTKDHLGKEGSQGKGMNPVPKEGKQEEEEDMKEPSYLPKWT